MLLVFIVFIVFFFSLSSSIETIYAIFLIKLYTKRNTREILHPSFLFLLHVRIELMCIVRSGLALYFPWQLSISMGRNVLSHCWVFSTCCARYHENFTRQRRHNIFKEATTMLRMGRSWPCLGESFVKSSASFAFHFGKNKLPLVILGSKISILASMAISRIFLLSERCPRNFQKSLEFGCSMETCEKTSTAGTNVGFWTAIEVKIWK